MNAIFHAAYSSTATKMFLALTLAATSFTSMARITGHSIPLSTKVISLNSISHLEIIGDVEIILTTRISGSLILFGNEETLKSVTSERKRQKLFVNVRSSTKTSPTKVYISMVLLRHLVVSGNSNIWTDGNPGNTDLVVELNGESSILIHPTSKIKLKPGEGYDLN